MGGCPESFSLKKLNLNIEMQNVYASRLLFMLTSQAFTEFNLEINEMKRSEEQDESQVSQVFLEYILRYLRSQ